MFRRLSHTLPRDPVFPADLEKLGFFVNDQDQIRMIKSPEQKYQYSINKNDRVNDLYKEAMNSQWMLMLCPPVYFVMLIHRCTACVRNIVLERLLHLGFEILRLPVGVPESENHVPILVSKDLRSKKRVVVLFGERNKDLGIFSYRVVGEEGIKVGSILDFVEAVLFGPTLTSDHDTPGVVITNPGQLLWYRGGSRAVTHSEWLSLPREYAVYEAFRIDPIKNTIPGNRDFREHVSYVFDHVLAEMIQPTALLDIIGLEYTGSAALEYLADHWDKWSGRVNGICLGDPQHKIQDLGAPESFVAFVRRRCRAYFVSPSPLETAMPDGEEFGCNCYASGEEFYCENVAVRSWRSMLDWFNMIDANPAFEEADLQQQTS